VLLYQFIYHLYCLCGQVANGGCDEGDDDAGGDCGDDPDGGESGEKIGCAD